MCRDAEIAARKGAVLTAQFAECAIVREQLFIFSAPRERHAAEGIAIPLDACLVAVKDGRKAVERVLQYACDLEQRNAAFLFKILHAGVRLFVVGHALCTSAAEHSQNALGVVRAEQVH